MVMIPRKDALATLAKAEKVSILESIISQKQKDIDTLTGRISVLNEIINQMSVIEDANKSIILSYEKQIKEMEDIRKLYDLDIRSLKKEVRKYKRKAFWTAMAGVATTIGALWLGSNIR